MELKEDNFCLDPENERTRLMMHTTHLWWSQLKGYLLQKKFCSKAAIKSVRFTDPSIKIQPAPWEEGNKLRNSLVESLFIVNDVKNLCSKQHGILVFIPGIVELVKKLGNPSFEREDEEVSNAIALCCSILPIA